MLTFFVTFVKIDIQLNDFARSIISAPVVTNYPPIDDQPSKLISREISDEKSEEPTEKKSTENDPVVGKKHNESVVRHPFKVADVQDLGVIKFPVPDFLKKTQERRQKYTKISALDTKYSFPREKDF